MARRSQGGMTLIEVMVALVVVGLGLFGAAMLQLRALQATDSARMSSQGAFVAQGVLEQVRARGEVSDLARAALHHEVEAFAGASSHGQVAQAGAETLVTLTWDDRRAGGAPRVLQIAGWVLP